VYDASGLLAAEYSTEQGAPPCTTCYLTADWLGSTRVMTNPTGTIVSQRDYAPFGEELASTLGRQDLLNYGSVDGVTQKFTSKERDSETGLDYFGARYLSSTQGRFTTPDQPLLAQEPANPQSWNLHSYTANNPLSRIDLDGRNWFQIGGNWEWHEGDEYTYTDKKKKSHTVHSNYTHLLVFQPGGGGGDADRNCLTSKRHGKSRWALWIFSPTGCKSLQTGYHCRASRSCSLVLFQNRRPQTSFHRGGCCCFLVLFQDRITDRNTFIADEHAPGTLGWI
jgi:RHS repeat-associated protein